MINGMGVSCADGVDWTPITMGDALDGLERRSHFKTLRWSKQVERGCRLDWHQFDNTALTSLMTPMEDNSEESEVYTTDVFCKSVKSVQTHGVHHEIQAIFLVYTGP
jgi:hypothetical protein